MFQGNRFPEFSFAFQPIANIQTGEILSYEALVRGPGSQPAEEIFAKIDPADKYQFDEILRTTAVRVAGRLGIRCSLNLNMLPRGLEVSKTAISSTIESAVQAGIPPHFLTIEITESEIIQNVDWFRENLRQYRESGVNFSIDDFGSGFSGLNLLADFQPESIKIDMSIMRDIDSNGPRQAIVRGIIRTCRDLGIDVVAEGIETNEECRWCFDEGIELIQGFFLALPGFELLPVPLIPKYFIE
jgi:blue light- and temperature-responsive anti-repressor